MRIITGSIKSTPIEWLPVLSHIEPPRVRRKQILVREYKKIIANPDLPIHQDLIHFNRLKSRSPSVRMAQQLITNNFDGYEEWQSDWQGKVSPTWHPLLISKEPPHGFNLPRKLWVRLNRIRTGHGRSGSALYRWGMRSNPECECGAASQTMGHITYECPLTALSWNKRRLVARDTGGHFLARSVKPGAVIIQTIIVIMFVIYVLVLMLYLLSSGMFEWTIS